MTSELFIYIRKMSPTLLNSVYSILYLLLGNDLNNIHISIYSCAILNIIMLPIIYIWHSYVLIRICTILICTLKVILCLCAVHIITICRSILCDCITKNNLHFAYVCSQIIDPFGCRHKLKTERLFSSS